MLACVGCRTRKIRCDRTKPACDGCRARAQKCIYPERRKRMTTGGTTDTGLGESVLNGLFERLSRVEQRCLRLDLTSGPLTSSPTSEPLLEYHASLHSDNDFEFCIPKPLDSLVDPAVCLQQALQEVLQLKQHHSTARPSSSLEQDIPCELAGACIQNFFKFYHIETFSRFINIKLIYLIPDIVNMSEVTIDPATLVLYHSILYHGSLMLLEGSTGLKHVGLTQQIYRRCLVIFPLWKDRISGTNTDLITAILLMRASFQQSDFDFSWDTYSIVYQCIIQLNLHNIDQGRSADDRFGINPLRRQVDGQAPINDPPSSTTDYDRKGFWSLVLTDVFFRLLHDKPAIMTANLTEWRVNLPLAHIELGPFSRDVAFAVALLVKMRLALLLVEFLDCVLDDQHSKRSWLERAEKLCHDIERLLHEWFVRDIMAANEKCYAGWWALYDLVLMAHSSMMVVRCRAEILESDLAIELGLGIGTRPSLSRDPPLQSPSPPSLRHGISPLPAKTARDILELALMGLQKFPIPNTASYLFGAFRCEIPYGHLVKAMLLRSNPPPMGHGDHGDLALLTRIAKIVGEVAAADSALQPLSRTLHDLISRVRRSWGLMR